MEQPKEFVGSYVIRRASHGESVIRVPSGATGEYALYANKDCSTIVLRKQMPFKDKKFVKDMEKAAAGTFVEWPMVKKEGVAE
jgi:hypothetical protein